MKPQPLLYTQAAVILLVVVIAMQPHPLRVANAISNETDYMALLAIKSQLIDLHPNGVLSSWNHSLHHCLWEGVICGRKHKRVTGLKLFGRGLSGTISPFIGNLSFLNIIWLDSNSLHGSIPPEIGRLLRLQSLYLPNNTLSGGIPASLSSCINLQNLSLAINNLEGELPMELGALSNLKWLWLHKNKLSGPIFKLILNLTSLVRIKGHTNAFTGPIPDNIPKLTNLTSLELSTNQLSGIIPPSISNLSSLQILDLSMNQLSGIIPPSIFNLSSLQILYLAYNQLRGSIPPHIALTLPQLQYLQLAYNYFSGPLPISIHNLTSLRSIELSNNYFKGTISNLHFGHLYNLQRLVISNNNLSGDINFITKLVNCSKLESLDVGNNQFTGLVPKVLANLSTNLIEIWIEGNQVTGGIPVGLGNLNNLRILSMKSSGLTGTVPRDLGELQNLEILDLSFNRLTGEIPSSFGNLSHLSNLNFYENKLQGRVPSSLGNCANLLYLYLSYNQFNGSLPIELFAKTTNFIQLWLDQNHFQGPLTMEISKQINLEVFSMSNNKFFGSIPDVFSSLPALQELYMEDNFFHGLIPPSFASLKSLLKLDLSQNNLSGPVPEYFATFPLIVLNLSHNNFEGRVPTKGVFANSSATSFVGNKNLCGGSSKLHLPRCVENERKKRRMSRALKLTIITASAFVGVLVMAICIWLYLKGQSKKRKSTSSSDALVKERFLKVSYDMLLKATDGFSQENLLGSGTFGSVFKGILDGKTVAVKVLNLQQRGGSKSFMAECEALRYIRHRNLVGILTACSSIDFKRNDFKALVYEFMPNGSLDKWLYKSGYLSLLQRVNIAIDVAHALNYLQCECETPIVHCDLKPNNILLDNDMVAHVGDFGLAKVLGQPLHPNQSSSIGVRGTVGYAAPEYGLGGEASPEADLYSYGILLLELMTKRRPTDNMFKEDFNLHMFAKAALPHQVLHIVDSTLMEDESDEPDKRGPKPHEMLRKTEECMVSVIKIGVACSSHLPRDRMKISEAISELQKARNILLSPKHKRNLPRGESD
ncbi:hypothetical protein SOVF_115320 [Spinacia oleracea]|uniref:non-specific serine/threonine protein kinase n=1 Tax=Spinacia oleracea TaxID=3562 RepID=A0A9R0J917_SPIOL|nr:probable LRR receptor-like serine/threonine-protein kinase At3g47570 [Spinacia oleracea]KNA13589.1 hypothetical protein SOVF_115320 [Spinacia oleracea]